MPTKQETFDTVAVALVRQGGPSLGKPSAGFGRCAYRGTNGRKCAAGHLIPDALYRKSMEGSFAYEGLVAEVLEDAGHDAEFVRQLQILHDDKAQSREDDSAWLTVWTHGMRRFAAHEELSTVAFDAALAEKGGQ